MNCPRCNSPLPDGAKFCGHCGAKLAPTQPQQQPVRVQRPIPQQQPASQRPAGQQTAPAAEEAVKPKKKNHVLPVLLAVILLALLGAGGFFLLKNRSSASKNAYVVLQDGSYMLLTDLDKGEMVEIDGLRGDSFYYASGLRFSDDGKYLYYFSKVTNNDHADSIGTLCRAEYGKLKPDSAKNDRYITVIDTNVSVLDVKPLDKGAVLYRRENDTLFYYDGKESYRLCKDVAYTYLDDTKQYLTILRSEDDSDSLYCYSLYMVDLKKPEDVVKLDSNVTNVVSYSNWNNILYTKLQSGNSFCTLYAASLNKAPEKLLTDCLYFEPPHGGNNAYLLQPTDTPDLTSVIQGLSIPTTEPKREDYPDQSSYEDALGLYFDLVDPGDAAYVNIYVIENGQQPTCVKTDQLVIPHSSHMDFFFTLDFSGDVTITDASNIHNWNDFLDEFISIGGVSFYYLQNEKFYTLTEGSYSDLFRVDWGEFPHLVSVADSLYLFTSNYVCTTLYQLRLDGDTIVGATEIAEDAEYLGVLNDTLYYYADQYSSASNPWNSYASLYACSGGSRTCLADDVLTSGVFIAEDGTLILQDGNSDYELSAMVPGGKEVFIADDVSDYVFIDLNTFLYISDGDLYYYHNGERKRLATDVETIWAKNSISVQNVYSLY